VGGDDENVAPTPIAVVGVASCEGSSARREPAAVAPTTARTAAPGGSAARPLTTRRAGPEFTPAAISAFIGKARAIINVESLPAALGSRTKNDLLLRKQAEVLFLREYIASGGAGDTAAQLHAATEKLRAAQLQVTLLSTDKAKLSVEVRTMRNTA